ncbi:ABC transporter permease [Paenibacillus beijingensis]|uniref:ABC transporter permease n=1 Tax=Paenibacillus beijingensis TaxID=1126833 RepID=A0A0D5NEQ8_9BACL|nr:ABC transporter permease [Paenibacillus beijingensis]AJY73620.1 hypothetical protein VN24_01985 [Paenibacillus beijingensis]
MNRELEQLWKRRAGAFRSEMMPYMGYVVQSGFPGFSVLLLILASVGYGTFIRDIPPDFPVMAAGVLLLTPLLCRSPLRTWLQPADTVFLLRLEPAMPAYIGRSIRRSLLPGTALALAALAVYWPLYRSEAGSGNAGAWTLAVMTAALFAANTVASWQERRMAWSGARRLARLLRWLLTAVAVSFFLTVEPWKALLFTLPAAALLAAAYRLPRRLSFPWERLIEEEERTRSRYYRFLGLFVDVPALPPRVYKRPYAAWIPSLITLRKSNAYRYWYTLTLIRTELGGILLRLLLLGLLVVYWLSDAAWLAGWGAAAVQLLFLGIAGVQLSALRLTHRFSVWRHVYPLPEERRNRSLLAVDRAANAALAVPLLLALTMPLMAAGHLAPAAAGVGATAAYLLLLRPARLRRKLSADQEED